MLDMLRYEAGSEDRVAYTAVCVPGDTRVTCTIGRRALLRTVVAIGTPLGDDQGIKELSPCREQPHFQNVNVCIVLA